MFISLQDIQTTLTYPQHDAVLNVKEDLFLVAVVPDQRVQRVGVGHPADEARVGRKRDD